MFKGDTRDFKRDETSGQFVKKTENQKVQTTNKDFELLRRRQGDSMELDDAEEERKDGIKEIKRRLIKQIANELVSYGKIRSWEQVLSAVKGDQSKFTLQNWSRDLVSDNTKDEMRKLYKVDEADVGPIYMYYKDTKK